LQEVLQVISPSRRTNYGGVAWKIQLFRADSLTYEDLILKRWDTTDIVL
jgi:hypothetical protein